MDKPFLELRDIRKKYFYLEKELEILKGINLRVEKGESIAIVGPSGVGKTTLLNIIGTLDLPTSGKLIFQGKEISYKNEEKLTKLRREKIGFVFQLHYLMPEFEVIENVMLPGLIAGFSREKAKKRAEELLDMLGLKDKANYKPPYLSGGERQRVAIARAIFLNPPLLLADEPTGNLDPETAKEVLKIFLKINEEYGTTLIVVTHNFELAKNMKKVYQLKKGILEEIAL